MYKKARISFFMAILLNQVELKTIFIIDEPWSHYSTKYINRSSNLQSSNCSKNVFEQLHFSSSNNFIKILIHEVETAEVFVKNNMQSYYLIKSRLSITQQNDPFITPRNNSFELIF